MDPETDRRGASARELDLLRQLAVARDREVALGEELGAARQRLLSANAEAAQLVATKAALAECEAERDALRDRLAAVEGSPAFRLLGRLRALARRLRA